MGRLRYRRHYWRYYCRYYWRHYWRHSWRYYYYWRHYGRYGRLLSGFERDAVGRVLPGARDLLLVPRLLVRQLRLHARVHGGEVVVLGVGLTGLELGLG